MDIRLVRTQITAIVWKELLEISRSTWRSSFVFVVSTVFVQWFIVGQYVNKLNRQHLEALGTGMRPLEMAATLSLMFTIPMAITLYTSGVLVRTFTKERLLGLLLPMLSTGVNPGVLWAGKVLAVFLGGCAVGAVCLVLNIVLITQYFQIATNFTVPVAVAVFVLAPMASLCIVAVLAFVLWVFRSAHWIAAILPTTVAVGLFSFAAARPVSDVVLSSVVMMTGCALLVIVGLALIISQVSRQFLVGL